MAGEIEELSVSDILHESKIMTLVLQILPVETQEPMLYYIKCEALWILINLCYGKDHDLDKIINYSDDNGYPETRASVLYNHIDFLYRQMYEESFADLKMFNLLL